MNGLDLRQAALAVIILSRAGVRRLATRIVERSESSGPAAASGRQLDDD